MQTYIYIQEAQDLFIVGAAHIGVSTRADKGQAFEVKPVYLWAS